MQTLASRPPPTLAEQALEKRIEQAHQTLLDGVPITSKVSADAPVKINEDHGGGALMSAEVAVPNPDSLASIPAVKKLRAMRVLMTITTIADELHADLLMRRVPSWDRLNRWMDELERAASAAAKLVDSFT